MVRQFMAAALVALPVSLAGGAAFAVSAPAPKYEYQCEIKAHRIGGWTPPSTQFSINEKNKTVTLTDPYIEAHGDGPIQSKYKSKKDGVIRFRWRTRLPTTEGTIYPVGYRIDFKPEDKTGIIYISVGSGANRDSPGTLICK